MILIIALSLLVFFAGFFFSVLSVLGISKLLKIENINFKKSALIVAIFVVVYIIEKIVESIISPTFDISLIAVGVAFAILILLIVPFQLIKRYIAPIKWWQFGLLLVVVLVITIIAMTIIRSFIAKPFQSMSTSMQPAINPGNIFIVDKLNKKFERGDIVVIKTRHDSGISFEGIVSRIIGLPLENLEIKNNQVIINGQVLNEPYAVGKTCGKVSQMECPDLSIKLSKDQYFVMADNREITMDSRAVGPINENDIIGKVVYIFGSTESNQYLQPLYKNEKRDQKSFVQDETADWKIYRNEKYGYEISLPALWKAYSEYDGRVIASSPSQFPQNPLILTGTPPSLDFQIEVMINNTIISYVNSFLSDAVQEGSKYIKEGKMFYLVQNGTDIIIISSSSNYNQNDKIFNSLKLIK